MQMPKKVFHIAYAVNYVLQAGFCLLCPGGLLVLLGWLAVNRWGAGRWALIVGILLGVLTGVYSMFRYILKSAKSFDPIDSKGGKPHDGKTG